MPTNETRSAVWQWLKDNFTDQAVQAPELTRQAVAHFLADEPFCQNFLREALYGYVYTIVIRFIGDRRSKIRSGARTNANVRRTMMALPNPSSFTPTTSPEQVKGWESPIPPSKRTISALDAATVLEDHIGGAWRKLLEHDPKTKTHIPLLEMTKEEALRSVRERYSNLESSLKAAALIALLAGKCEPGQKLGEVWTEAEISDLFESIVVIPHRAVELRDSSTFRTPTVMDRLTGGAHAGDA